MLDFLLDFSKYIVYDVVIADFSLATEVDFFD